MKDAVGAFILMPGITLKVKTQVEFLLNKIIDTVIVKVGRVILIFQGLTKLKDTLRLMVIMKLMRLQ